MQTQFTGLIARTETFAEQMAEVIIFFKQNPNILRELVSAQRSRGLSLVETAFMVLVEPGINVEIKHVTADRDEHGNRFEALLEADEVIAKLLGFKAQDLTAVETLIDILQQPECRDPYLPLAAKKLYVFLCAAAEASEAFSAAGEIATKLGGEALELVKIPVRSDQSIIVEAVDADP